DARGQLAEFPSSVSGRASACGVASRNRCRLRSRAFSLLYRPLSEYLLLGLRGSASFYSVPGRTTHCIRQRISSWAIFCFHFSPVDCHGAFGSRRALDDWRMGSPAAHCHRLGDSHGVFCMDCPSIVPSAPRARLHWRAICLGHLLIFARLLSLPQFSLESS